MKLGQTRRHLDECQQLDSLFCKMMPIMPSMLRVAPGVEELDVVSEVV